MKYRKNIKIDIEFRMFHIHNSVIILVVLVVESNIVGSQKRGGRPKT